MTSSHRLAALGLFLTSLHHVGFMWVSLAMFEEVAYGMAAASVALGCLLAFTALRDGWETRTGLFLSGSALAGIVVFGRFVAAEWGVLDATTPLAALLAVGYVTWLVGAWQLHQCHPERRIGGTLAVGAATIAVSNSGFAFVAYAAGGIPIGTALLVGVVGAALMASGGLRLSRHVIGTREGASRAVASQLRPAGRP